MPQEPFPVSRNNPEYFRTILMHEPPANILEFRLARPENRDCTKRCRR